MIDALRTRAAGRCTVPPQSAGALAATVLLGAPALFLSAIPGAAAWFEFDRAAIASGQLWRVVTGHWTHWSADHLVWDLVALCVLVWIGWSKGPKRVLATVAISAVAISAAVWFVTGEITHYRGLSGIDSALFVLVAVTVFREELVGGRRVMAFAVALVVAGFAGKVVFEMATGTAVFADSTHWVPLPLAHVVGGLCGWLTSPRNRGVTC